MHFPNVVRIPPLPKPFQNCWLLLGLPTWNFYAGKRVAQQAVVLCIFILKSDQRHSFGVWLMLVSISTLCSQNICDQNMNGREITSICRDWPAYSSTSTPRPSIHWQRCQGCQCWRSWSWWWGGQSWSLLGRGGGRWRSTSPAHPSLCWSLCWPDQQFRSWGEPNDSKSNTFPFLLEGYSSHPLPPGGRGQKKSTLLENIARPRGRADCWVQSTADQQFNTLSRSKWPEVIVWYQLLCRLQINYSTKKTSSSSHQVTRKLVSRKIRWWKTCSPPSHSSMKVTPSPRVKITWVTAFK